VFDKFLYALPICQHVENTFHGCRSRDPIDVMFKKASKWNLVPETSTVDELLLTSDHRL
jgi:hypothetical protein